MQGSSLTLLRFREGVLAALLPLFVLFRLPGHPIQLIRFRPQLAISGVYSRKRVRCRSVPALAALHANIGTTRSIFERCAAFVRERAQLLSLYCRLMPSSGIEVAA
jgi:hypothetical protein